MSTAIRLEHVSKRFTLHRRRARSFQDLVVGMFQRDNKTLAGPESEPDGDFWALRDVSFSVEEGETVGVIGPNGAGKSTLLKLISRIIEPTSGEIEVNGRVGALLELGAGFHPDLTGRENIYLNGSILGLSRAEIETRLDEIIAFAELERFIDMPVKHYSSGMHMRLGFSVAVHTDPKILLVDEVLAVGDENFQHKCLDRIMDLRREGITICFVSHGLGQVRRLCSRALWVNDGRVEANGDVDDVISSYLSCAANEEEDRMWEPVNSGEKGGDVEETAVDERGIVAERGQSGVAAGELVAQHDESGGEVDKAEVEILGVSFVDPADAERWVFRVGQSWAARIHYQASPRAESITFGLTIHRNDGVHVGGSSVRLIDLLDGPLKRQGSVVYRVDELPFMEGTYLVSVLAEDDSGLVTFDHHDRRHRFKVRQVGIGERYGLASLGGKWQLKTETEMSSSVMDSRDGKETGERASLGSRGRGRWGTGDLEVVEVACIDKSGNERRVFESGEEWGVKLCYRAHRRLEESVFGLAVHSANGVHVCGPNTHVGGLDIPPIEGSGEVLYQVNHLPLMEGRYYLSVSAHDRADTVMYDYHDRLYTFKVCQLDSCGGDGIITLTGDWTWEGEGTK